MSLRPLFARSLVLGLAAALSLGASAAASEDLSAARITQTVREMTDDFYQGRAPGTLGEERTVGYLIGRFQALGLEPAGTGANGCRTCRCSTPGWERRSSLR